MSRVNVLPGITTNGKSTVPSAGTLNATGISMIRSGTPMFQPFTNFIGVGASFGLPGCAPPSTQVTRVFTCCGVSFRSLEKWPYCGSAYHGGIFFVSTAILMATAHGRASS